MNQLEYEDENYIVSIVNNSIIHIKIKDFQELQMEDIVSMQEWTQKVTSNRKLVSLIQFGNGSSATREAREYATSPEGITTTIGSAVLVKNLAQQLIVDYYIKFNKPLLPTAVFYKYSKAMKWIENLLEEYN